MTHRQRILPVRILFATFGLACVGVGFVGLVTPGLPGFVFFLIALWAFRNSSSRMEEWLLENKAVGPALKDWDETRSMKRSTKMIAISAIWLAILVTCYRILSKFKGDFEISGQQIHVPTWFPILLLLLTAILLTIFLGKVKTKNSALPSK
jgi:uncharacterized protein